MAAVERGRSFVSLNAVTAIGAGQVAAYLPKDAGYFSYAWQTAITGAPTAININLEGSLDGTTWAVMDTSTVVGGEMRFLNTKNAIFIRANLTTLTGGTAPTVTVTLAAF